jgi:hypothetical protein
MGLVEVLEEDAGVGDGTAAGGVGGDGADLFEGFGDGKAGGIFDEQEDAALGGEGRDGDEAEVGCSGVELGGTDGGRGVMHIVVGAESGGGGLVFEVVEQRSRVQKSDGGDT